MRQQTKMNSREALYGFVAWLTTRRGRIQLGEKYSAAGIVDLLEEWANYNGLPDVTNNYPENIKMPRQGK